MSEQLKDAAKTHALHDDIENDPPAREESDWAPEAGYDGDGSAAAQPVQAEPNGWRCFHCGANFAENEAAEAALHFGTSEHDAPACQISIEHVRWMEAQNRRAVDEDTDALRAVRSLVNEHETLRRRAEEQGYARGLADAKKHPEELGLIAVSPSKQNYLETPIDWDLNGVPYTRKQAILDHCGPLALSYVEHAISYYTKD